MIDVSPYWIELATLAGAGPLDWPAVFGNANPVELEVGSGKGLFLANAGSSVPERNFLGIELARKYARKAAERVAKQGLANVRVVQGDVRVLLARHMRPASVCAVHIYFPDPWWKKRHKKRRVFTAGFVDEVARILTPGGDFHVVTDVEEYFGVMRAILAGDARFRELPAPSPTAPEHDLDYLTNFERKYRLEGRPIYRAHYRLG